MAAIARLARSRLCIPLTRHPLHSGTPVNSELAVPGEPQRSKLVVPKGSYSFPLGDGAFTDFRDNGLVYIDKTQFIDPLSRYTATLLCRPRRFGRTLTVSMLRYFHGVEYLDNYGKFFGGLAVYKAKAADRKIQPGKYLVMNFDFSANMPGNVDHASTLFHENISDSIDDFARQCTPYLGNEMTQIVSRFSTDQVRNLGLLVDGVSQELARIKMEGKSDHPLVDVEGIYLLADEYDAFANPYMDPHDRNAWKGSGVAGALKSFWAAVKAATDDQYGINKVFLTGISPLLLTDLSGCGFNIAQNISFLPEFATVCGLTKDDVTNALRLLFKNDEEMVQEHLAKLEKYTNGYHFSNSETVPTVFNPDTVMWYLDRVRESGGKSPSLIDPPHSEISEGILMRCAGAPAAVNIMQLALQKGDDGSYPKLSYDKIITNFKIEELANGDVDPSAWRSLMVYAGGLTFDSEEPTKFLKIPNLVAAHRFGRAVLERLGILRTISIALGTLSTTGAPDQVLSGYLRLMRERDVGEASFVRSEEDHRDSLYAVMLNNPTITPHAEFKAKKVSGGDGLVDLLITSNSPNGCYTVLEFKNKQIDYLALEGSSRTDKAEQLVAMSLPQILNLQITGCAI